MTRTPVFCASHGLFGIAAAAVATLASSTLAATYSDAVSALNPVVYYQYEIADNTANNVATGSNSAGLARMTSYDWTGPGAIQADVFGTASTLNPAGGFLGFDSTNKVASYPAGGTGTAAEIAPTRRITSLYDLSPSPNNNAIYKGNVTTALTGASAVSVVAWINLDSVASGTTQSIASGLNGSSAASFLQLTVVNGSLEIGGRSKTSDAFVFETFTDGPQVTAGTWHQVVGILDYTTNTVSAYLDGGLVGTAAPTTTAGAASTWDTSLSFGTGTGAGVLASGSLYNSILTAGGRGSSANSKQLVGQVDELTFFNYALSGEQVSNLYATAIPEPTSLAGIALLTAGLLRRRSR